MPIHTPQESGQVLTPRDRKIIDQLAENHILTTEQISALFFKSSQTCRNRMIYLKKAGWLKEERPFHFYNNTSRILKLGDLACKTFGYSSSRSFASFFVEHQLGLNEIYVQLFKKGVIEKLNIAWQDGSKFILPYEKNFIRPDARVIHPVANFETYIEFDRGTKNLLTILDNITNYLNYYDEKELRSKEGQKGIIQVVYITPEKSRAKSIDEVFQKLVLKQSRTFSQVNWDFDFHSLTEEEFFQTCFSILDYQKVLVEGCSKIEHKKETPESKSKSFWDQIPPEIRSKLQEGMG